MQEAKVVETPEMNDEIRSGQIDTESGGGESGKGIPYKKKKPHFHKKPRNLRGKHNCFNGFRR